MNAWWSLVLHPVFVHVTTLAPTFSSLLPPSSPVISVWDAIYEYETVGTPHSQTHADTQDTVEHQTTMTGGSDNKTAKNLNKQRVSLLILSHLCNAIWKYWSSPPPKWKHKTYTLVDIPILTMKICKPRSGRVIEKLYLRYIYIIWRVRRQYGWILHECAAVFSWATGEWKKKKKQHKSAISSHIAFSHIK